LLGILLVAQNEDRKGNSIQGHGAVLNHEDEKLERAAEARQWNSRGALRVDPRESSRYAGSSRGLGTDLLERW